MGDANQANNNASGGNAPPTGRDSAESSSDSQRTSGPRLLYRVRSLGGEAGVHLFGMLFRVTALTLSGALCATLVYSVVWLCWLVVANPMFPLNVKAYFSPYGEFRDLISSGRGDNETTFRDWAIVAQDHEPIIRWLLDCKGIDSVTQLTTDQINFLTLPNDVLRSYARAAVTEPQPALKLSPKERSVVQLSRALGVQRLALIEKVKSAYLFWEVATIVSIGIGMITTILVSLSSTEFGRDSGGIQRAIRLLAIIFPALGTAMAAIIGFYSPQAQWAQSSRTLASETQLHGQMALAIAGVTCPTGAADATADKQLDVLLADWSKRMIDIQTIANAAGSSTSGQASGSGGGTGGAGAGGSGGSTTVPTSGSAGSSTPSAPPSPGR